MEGQGGQGGPGGLQVGGSKASLWGPTEMYLQGCRGT